MPGYLPNDVALEFDNWHDAKNCLLDNIDIIWDEAEEAGHDTSDIIEAHTMIHMATPDRPLIVEAGGEVWWIELW